LTVLRSFICPKNKLYRQCTETRPWAQLDPAAGERRLQPAEAPFLPCCRVNAAFLCSGWRWCEVALTTCAFAFHLANGSDARFNARLRLAG
jgi:hypothetical protein